VYPGPGAPFRAAGAHIVSDADADHPWLPPAHGEPHNRINHRGGNKAGHNPAQPPLPRVGTVAPHVVVVVGTELEGAALEGAAFSPVEFPSWMDWLRDYTGEPDHTEYELEEVRQMRPDQTDEADKRDAVPMRAEATD
jgi:hypothetical protein